MININTYVQAEQVLSDTKAKMNQTKEQFSKDFIKQIEADYQNCILAKEIADETNDKHDISLFVWLVQMYSKEVNTISWFEKKLSEEDIDSELLEQLLQDPTTFSETNETSGQVNSKKAYFL